MIDPTVPELAALQDAMKEFETVKNAYVAKAPTMKPEMFWRKTRGMRFWLQLAINRVALSAESEYITPPKRISPFLVLITLR